MTGFGSAEGQLSARLLAHVRLTSVNARYLELSLRTTPRLDQAELEVGVRRALATHLARGRVQLNLDLEQTALPGFAEGLGELELDGEEQRRLLELIGQAAGRLAADREKEAAALLPQIEGEVAELESFAVWLDSVNGELRSVLLERMRERLASLLQGTTAVPEERLLQEAAVLADRADVSEEVQRLKAHLAHLRALLDEGATVGKKLDFLLQELLREVNTSASKCREAGMGERVVAAKAALEKLREQAANLE